MEKVSVNGVMIAYSHHGEGTPLVLLHGYPLDHSIWNDLVPLLEGEFELILPDLRGFGISATTAAAYGMTDMAEDIAGLLDHLGIKKAMLAGHSMGGYVALAFARKYLQRIAGLALISSQALADTRARRAIAVTVAVGLIERRAEFHGRLARVEAVRGEARRMDVEPGVAGFARHAGADLVGMIAAGHKISPRAHRSVVAARENLDHATDGLGTVEAGPRAAHNFNTVDFRQRQEFPSRRAGCRRTNFDAIDQHQHLTGIRAAYVGIGEFSVSALGREIHARHAAQ